MYRQTGSRAVYLTSREGYKNEEHAGTSLEGRGRTGPDRIRVAIGSGSVGCDRVARNPRDRDQQDVLERRFKPKHLIGLAELVWAWARPLGRPQISSGFCLL